MSQNSFGARDKLAVGEREYEIFRLDVLQREYDVARLPFSLKVLLENLLRTEGNGSVSASDIEALARWDAKADPSKEISFTPARVLLQDLTGVPAVVDLAAMRDAMADMGGDPARINPLAPAELVIDHSVQVDAFGTRDAFRLNAEREFERNQERYLFLRWGQGAFEHFAVVPPDTGIVHQVNLEYLARVVFDDTERGQAYPDTLLGTDSHTTMVNGLGVLGWGVGGIEAEAAMLGQPVSMLIPQVLGFKLHGEMPAWHDRNRPRADGHREAARARRGGDVRRVLRRRTGVAADRRPRHDRQHVAGVRLHLRDLSDRLRDDRLPAPDRAPRAPDRAGRGLRPRAGSVARRGSEEPTFSDHIELDLGEVEPCSRGPAARRTGSRCAVRASPSAMPWPRSPVATAHRRPPGTPTTRPRKRATPLRTRPPTACRGTTPRRPPSRCRRTPRARPAQPWRARSSAATAPSR